MSDGELVPDEQPLAGRKTEVVLTLEHYNELMHGYMEWKYRGGGGGGEGGFAWRDFLLGFAVALMLALFVLVIRLL